MAYLLFFLSGAAALMYESVWTRYLGLFVGHDAYAQVVVLVIFLGGMSAGAWLVSRRTVSIVRPLRVYALVEAAVGLIGLAFHDIFVATSALAYDHLFPALGSGAAVDAVKWTLAALLILPQSILLGTTFPLMSAAVIRVQRELPGRVLSWLYFTNSLGAAIGVLLAGFVLLDLAGLPGVLVAAGTINLVVALGAMILGRQSTGAPAHPLVATEPRHPQTVSRLEPLLLAMAFGTAVASFAYEIDWIRMLSLVLGSATHSFELMLSAFILGLALGALYIRRRIDRLTDPLTTLAHIQVAMGLVAVMTLPLYVGSFSWTATWLRAFTRSGEGYAAYMFVRYATCLVVMLPATFLAGMTLPLITHILMRRGGGERVIGRVYAWNTLGSITGVALAALVLLPIMGLKWMLIGAGALDAALGITLLVLAGGRRGAARWAGATAVTLGAIAWLVPLDRALITSGVFRSGRVNAVPETAIRFYADGRTATVAVAGFEDGSRLISTNGKTDASLDAAWREACDTDAIRVRIGGDEITQALLPIVTMSYRPHARTAAVIGFGSGMSSHILLASEAMQTVNTIEIEPMMVAGARHFLPANRRAYEDPRSHVIVRDAKAHFATAAQRWDIILSEPSNPWVSGVSGLFTVEFYRRVRAALADGGVFGQWLHTYELSDPLVLGVLAALDQVFPSWQVHQVGPGDLLIVASATTLPEPGFAAVLAMPALRHDLCRFVPITGSDLEAVVLGGNTLLAPLLAEIGQPNSDFYPALDLGAERARFTHASASGFVALGRDWFNLASALAGARTITPSAPRMPFEGISRATDAWIRDGLDDADTVDVYREHARWSWQQWELLTTADRAPVSWARWLDVMNEAASLRHGAVAGSADAGFFARAEAVARRWHAPVEVLAAIRFRKGVRDWDARPALDAADQLRTSQRGLALIGFDELRDGAVVMALRDGDAGLATRWLNAPGSVRPPDDLRSLLLGAWVRRAAGQSAPRDDKPPAH
ncbi:MAG: spermidine synthase [Gemmatimonadales bacterium]|nr:spermidine synthase [Gemmatimonadales bacterium]